MECLCLILCGLRYSVFVGSNRSARHKNVTKRQSADYCQETLFPGSFYPLLLGNPVQSVIRVRMIQLPTSHRANAGGVEFVDV